MLPMRKRKRMDLEMRLRNEMELAELARRGVKESELHLLEIALCYLTDFDLQVDNELLYRKMLAFQQCAFQASMMTRSKAASEMKLHIPVRTKVSAV